MEQNRFSQEADRVPRALTIAGSDSGGCAGIQADLKTFAALGVHGMSAVTSVTAQNTLEVSRVLHLPPEMIAQQVEAVAKDIGIDAVKTGMLATPQIISVVAESIRSHGLSTLVVDPVMISTSGSKLIEDDAVATLVEELFPHALLVTPNLPEAERLVGCSLRSDSDIWDAARNILRMGPQAVIIKGGHATDAAESIDYFFDGLRTERLRAKRLQTHNTHGSGCTFAAAVTAYLARRESPLEACRRAKRYVSEALAHSLSIGRGHGPLGHLWAWWEQLGE